ncbi:MAG TPA: APC family permease [Candidatus Acidoferrales bacterium]|nr:APC family permease [Candidatus Acidoferrales bacterium]
MSDTKVRKTVFVRDATGLVKQISGMDALGMCITQMGLLYVFNVVAFTPGFYPTANPLLGPFIGLLLVLPIAGMYVLFSIAIPRSGGDYVWVGRVFHPGIGFITNFAFTILSISVVGAVAPWIGQWSIAQLYYDLGILDKNAGYTAVANALQTPSSAFWISAVFIIIAGLIVITSSRLAARTVKYWTVLSIIIGFIFIATVLSAGSSTFAQNFNALSGSNMTYDQIVNAGQPLGAYSGVPPLISSASLYAAALGLLGYLGFNSSAYFAGETKQNHMTQIMAQIGGAVIFAIFTTAMIAVEYFGEGPSFVNSMAAMWLAGSSSYPYLAGTPPLASGLAMFWTQNQVLIAIFTLSFGLTAEVMNVSIFFTLSRNLFAWSFDRVGPSIFANVNSRTRTPVYAIAIMTAVGLLYAYISIFQYGLLATLFTYGTAGTFMVFLIVSLAAIAFPYVRKDIFEASHPLSKKKLGGVPVISLLGGLSFIVSIVVVYAILLPAIGNVGSVLLTGILPTFVVGAIIYIIAWAVRRGQGIDLNMLQREIPPE